MIRLKNSISCTRLLNSNAVAMTLRCCVVTLSSPQWQPTNWESKWENGIFRYLFVIKKKTQNVFPLAIVHDHKTLYTNFIIIINNFGFLVGLHVKLTMNGTHCCDLFTFIKNVVYSMK